MLKNLSLIVGSILLFSSCENDFEIVDEYKETLVIYSLLNANDSVQYIRVQKAYLGKGNAYIMAQVADSLYPDTAAISVTMQKVTNGIALDSFIHFVPTSEFTKEEGLFTNAPHIIYKSVNSPATPFKDDYIDRNAIYRLKLLNHHSGTTLEAETRVVKDVVLELTSPLLYPSTNINLAGEFPLKIEATMPEAGKILNLTVLFRYTEYTIGSSLIENKVVRYQLDDNIANNDAGGTKFTYELSGDQFFAFLRSNLKVNTNVLRPAGLVTLDFVFTVGAEEFFNYYSVGNSSAFLNDAVPSYTNVTNGLGIFSSRSTRIFAAKKLTGESQDSLANGQYTDDLFD